MTAGRNPRAVSDTASSLKGNPIQDLLTIPFRGLPSGWTAFFPIVFFAALLFSRSTEPPILVFDEIHYVPAAKQLITFTDNLNWVHPPFAKLILGMFWLLFTKTFHLIGEPAVFRVASTVFGLWALWSVRAWLRALGFRERATQAAMWLTGFNFLWFVQSKMAMLDIFYIAFAMWGALWVYEGRDAESSSRAVRYWAGWIFLGLAMACKWAALPIVLVAILICFARGSVSPFRRIANAALGFVLASTAYVACFIPLSFLARNAVPMGELAAHHALIIKGLVALADAHHPYASRWWQWVTLVRPMWYAFETDSSGQRTIWAGGNPLLYWIALPLLFLITIDAIRHAGDRAARRSRLLLSEGTLTILYWLPLLFWALMPRHLQLYYYYLPSSFWVGPILVWAHERYIRGIDQDRFHRDWILTGFTLLAGAVFFYFLPILDGRLIPEGRFMLYMWLKSWF